jgi:olfactory receptor
MNRQLCTGLTGSTWSIGASTLQFYTSLTFHLVYSGPHHIAYFFCDVTPVLKFPCEDTSINELVVLTNISVVAAACWILIVIAYIFIVASALRICTAEGRQRAFSTCTAHLTVVLLYYVPPASIYLQPSSSGPGAGAPSVFYTIVTPMLYPFICTLWDKEVKRALRRLLGRGSRESPAGSPPP